MQADPSTIFEQSRVGGAWRRRRALPVSIALHVVVFVLLLKGRAPVLVAPTLAMAGEHGTSLTHLYWAAGSAGLSPSKTAASKSTKNPKTHLVYKKPERAQLAANSEPATPEGKADHDAERSVPAPPAGSPYGSLADSSGVGEEIRPALPAMTAEPHVDPEDLRGVAEGNVVVEITIDEAGNIVRKAVVQSMGPAIDAKVLAALENWRFHPATRDGIPIPSKQDVVYHFKPRPS